MKFLELIIKTIDLVMGISTEVSDNKTEKSMQKLEMFASEYLQQHGQAARDWLQQEMKSIFKQLLDTLVESDPKTPQIEIPASLYEDLINLIAKGHLSKSIDFLHEGLLDIGYDKVSAGTMAFLGLSILANKIAMVRAAGPDAAVGETGELTKVEKQASYFQINQVQKKRRIVCPNCYRVIREWDPTRGGMNFAPKEIICKECKHQLATRLPTWQQISLWEKFFTVLWSFVLVALGIFIITASLGLFMVILGTLLIIFGIFLGINTWYRIKESPTTPIW